MATLIARRLLTFIPLLLIVTAITAILVELTPGDAATYVAGEGASPEQVEQVRERLGLGDSLPVRYLRYIAAAAQGDLGQSLVTQTLVWETIRTRLAVSIPLMTYAMLLAMLVGFPLGIVSAVMWRRWPDRLANGTASVMMAIPPFVTAIVLLTVFAVNRRVFPATGFVAPSQSFTEFLRFATLPAIALAALPAAEIARQTRSALVDALLRDYTRTARAKGLPPLRVVAKHAGKNAGIPVVTILGLIVARLLGGTVLVERIFAIPGFGSLVLDAITQHDIPMIQGVVLTSAIIVLLASLFVDLSYFYFNPRLRRR